MSIERFEPTAKAQPWGREELVARVPGIATAKLLRRYKDWPRAGLQYHERKFECFYLLSGKAYVYYVAKDGQLHRTLMKKGDAFLIPPGTIHSVQTISDSVMVEASNDVSDDRVRVEDDYDIENFVDDDAE